MADFNHRGSVLESAYNTNYNALEVLPRTHYEEVIDSYLCKNNGTTVPTVALSLSDRTVTVAATTGAAVGDCIC